MKFGAIALVITALILMSSDGGQAGGFTSVGQRKQFPPFRFPDLKGKEWSLSDHRGQGVLVNFWASWCQPCREETPGLVRLADKYASKGLNIVGVSLDEGGVDAVRSFAQAYKVAYPLLLPPPESPVIGSIESLPTTFLLDREGRVVKVYRGAIREAVFQADVDSLLSSP